MGNGMESVLNFLKMEIFIETKICKGKCGETKPLCEFSIRLDFEVDL